MTKTAALLASLCLAGAAHAQSISYSFSGNGTSPYDVVTSGFTITGFNSTLGTLNKAVIATSGTLTATVQPTAGYTPNASYNFHSSEGIYQSIGLATYGGNGLAGTGDVSYTNPNASPPDYTYLIPLSGSGETTYLGGQLAQFIDTDISGYFLFDAPGGSLTANGQPVSYTLVSSSATGSGSITYFYTPFRSALPEPASWAMMIGGLGLAGAAARQRRDRMKAA